MTAWSVSFSQALSYVLAGHRKRLGMSHMDVASRLGVHQSTISRREAGQVDVTVEDLRTLAGLLQVPADTLLSQAETVLDQLRTAGVTVVPHGQETLGMDGIRAVLVFGARYA